MPGEKRVKIRIDSFAAPAGLTAWWKVCPSNWLRLWRTLAGSISHSSSTKTSTSLDRANAATKDWRGFRFTFQHRKVLLAATRLR